MLWTLHLEQAHARNNGTDEVYVEDGVNINQVKDHGQSQKSKTRKGRHRGVVVLVLNAPKMEGEAALRGLGR